MRKRYQDTYRRTLLDMHIPDWDPAFLSEYDPRTLAQHYAKAGIDGALLYAKSHLGLSYWPTPVGGIHPAAAQRDLLGELLGELRALGMGVGVYHSVIFDNWAAQQHPEWRVVSERTLRGEPNRTALGRRYGTLCPNQPGYRDYELTQLTALLERYDFDTLWIDMVFWTAVCVCDRCRERLQTEEGMALPTRVDWSDPDWCRFVSARERWLDEFWQLIRTTALAVRPGIAVTHNIGTAFGSWYSGSMTWQSADDDFTGGDLYGGRDEQLFVSKLMNGLSRGLPEYMTSRSPDLRYHVQVRDERDMLVHALGATAHHLAFLMIDAIDPVGTVEPGIYERMGRVFERTAPYEAALGGRAAQDVAIYFSDNSKMSWAETGQYLSDRPDSARPHQRAAFGAARALQALHIPFGVLTRARLADLADYRVVILGDVTRMDADEVTAIREYVRGGGHVYASGRTSQGDVSGSRGDFALRDVFGVRAEETYDGGIVFVRPGTALAEAVSPERYVSWGLPASADWLENTPIGPLNLTFVGLDDEAAEVLAKLTLPYGFPHPGGLEEQGFASIHSSPPWTDTDRPAIIAHRFGAGRSVYSAVPIEGTDDDASRRLFGALLDDLLDGRARLTAITPRRVWLTLFDQPDRSRMVLSVLNYEPEHGLTATVQVNAVPPAGFRVTTVRDAVSGERLEFDLAGGGAAGEIDVELFAQLLLELEPEAFSETSITT